MTSPLQPEPPRQPPAATPSPSRRAPAPTPAPRRAPRPAPVAAPSTTAAAEPPAGASVSPNATRLVRCEIRSSACDTPSGFIVPGVLTDRDAEIAAINLHGWARLKRGLACRRCAANAALAEDLAGTDEGVLPAAGRQRARWDDEAVYWGRGG